MGLFLEGNKVEKETRLLLYAGCTTNILLETLFDSLPQRTRDQLTAPEVEHGLTADGSLLRFYRDVSLNCKTAHRRWRENFMVEKIKDPVILGIPFFIDQRTVLNFPTVELELPTRNLSCVTKDGYPSKV